MNLLYYKLTIAPLLVVGATLAGRRWGQVASGLVAGFPIVAGPVLVFFALEQGNLFAAGAAQDTLLGLVSLSFFIVVYGWRAWAGATPVACALAGWLGFALGTLLIGRVHASLPKALIWALLALFLARKSLPTVKDDQEPGPPSAWDLPLRALAAAAMVLGLTYFADYLGPRISGFLTPFPVASTVLTVFAHTQGGGAAAESVLKGLLLALNAFAGFCVVLAWTLPTHSIAVSFSLALAAATVIQALLFWMTQKR
jgi:hypothetical protein